jgi:hypothetical protein
LIKLSEFRLKMGRDGTEFGEGCPEVGEDWALLIPELPLNPV